MQSIKILFAAFIAMSLFSCGSSTSKNDKAPVAVGPGLAINEESFPDLGLQKFFLSQGYGADGAISDEELQSVTMLDLSNMQLRSLSGIERFPNLSVLKLNGNVLEELDVPAIPTLEELYCANCGMKRLNVKACPQLRVLYCQENKLDSLILEGMPLLEQVEANNNVMKKVVFTDCPQLRTINLASNKLSAADLSKCAALYDLNVAENPLQIENIDVDAFVKNLPKATASDAVTPPHAPTIVGLDEGSLSNNNKNMLKQKGWSLK